MTHEAYLFDEASFQKAGAKGDELERYFDHEDDIGLGAAWTEIAPLLGKHGLDPENFLGAPTEAVGVYLQSQKDVTVNLEALRKAIGEREDVEPPLFVLEEMLATAEDEDSALIVLVSSP